MAGFEVTTNGRFWVTAEAFDKCLASQHRLLIRASVKLLDLLFHPLAYEFLVLQTHINNGTLMMGRAIYFQ